MFPARFYPGRFFARSYFPACGHSMAGYRVYRRPTPTSARTLIATVAPGSGEHLLAALPALGVGYYEVRAVSHCGVEDIEATRLIRVAMDADALLITPAPNAPLQLRLSLLPDGYIRAAWSYLPGGQGVSPGNFAVRAAVLPALIDYNAAADATIAYSSLREFTATLGPFDDGDIVAVNVQALASIADGGAADGNRREVRILVDAQAPEPAQFVTVSARSSR